MVPSPIRWPRPSSSPRMRRCPQRGFSLASRTTRSRSSSGIGGRPAGFGYVQCLVASRHAMPAACPASRSDGAGACRAAAVPARPAAPGRPSSVSAGRPDGATRRPHAAAPRSPSPWRHHFARGAPISRTAGPSADTADGQTRALSLEDQVRCRGRVMAPHRCVGTLGFPGRPIRRWAMITARPLRSTSRIGE
jgi:hypothetical protein